MWILEPLYNTQAEPPLDNVYVDCEFMFMFKIISFMKVQYLFLCINGITFKRLLTTSFPMKVVAIKSKFVSLNIWKNKIN